MSVKMRLIGTAAGLALGVAAPLGIPLLIGAVASSIRNRGRAAFKSNAQAGLILAVVPTVIGGIVLAGVATAAVVFTPFGLPWFVTVPALYFTTFGLLGAVTLGNEPLGLATNS